MERTIELSYLWRRVWQKRVPIGAMVLVACLGTAGVSFLMKPWFRASGSLMPPAEEEVGFGLAKLLKGASVPGIKIPTQATPADVFISVLESRRISEEMVQRFGLQKKYKKKLKEDAVKELKRHARFKLTDAGIIEMSVEDTDPRTAADMLGAYIQLLDQFNREVRTTKGRRTRQFVEARLTENKADLSKAEERLSVYQSRHKAAVISPEMSTAIEQAARIYAQRTALEVRLSLVRSYVRDGSDEEAQIRGQLAALDRQLSQLPETGLELARLMRDVKMQETVYALLTAQFEEARIDEARDITSVDVLDPPAPPERKIRPRRTIMVVSAFLLSLAVGIGWALFQEDRDRPRSSSVTV
jgi:uncharacterized protein involved in exopolysaccharide biosynthesis